MSEFTRLLKVGLLLLLWQCMAVHAVGQSFSVHTWESTYCLQNVTYYVHVPGMNFQSGISVRLANGPDTLYPAGVQPYVNHADRFYFDHTAPITFGGSVDILVETPASGEVLLQDAYWLQDTIVSAYSPTAITPNQTLNVSITGNNTTFGQGTGTVVQLRRSNLVIPAAAISVSSATQLTATFQVPADGVRFTWDLITFSGDIYTITEDAFTVTNPSPTDYYVNQLGCPHPMQVGVPFEVVTSVSESSSPMPATSSVILAHGGDTLWPDSIEYLAPSALRGYFTPTASTSGLYEVFLQPTGWPWVITFDSYYLYGPRLIAISQSSADEQTNTTLTVTGESTNFGSSGSPLMAMESNGDTIWATNVTVNSATSMTGDFALPAVTADRDYRVFVWDNEYAGLPAAAGFTVEEVPVAGPLQLIGPLSMKPGDPYIVEVHYAQGGMNGGIPFYLERNGVQVYPSSSVINTQTNLRRWFTLPNDAVGTWSVNIDLPNGATATAPDSIFADARILTSITPDEGDENTTLSVSVTGQNTAFGQGTGTVLGIYAGTDTVFATNVQVQSSTQLTGDLALPHVNISGPSRPFTVFVFDTGWVELPAPETFDVIDTYSLGYLQLQEPRRAWAGYASTIRVRYAVGGLTPSTQFFLTQGSDTLWPDSSAYESSTILERWFTFPANATGGWRATIQAPNGQFALANANAAIQTHYLSACAPAAGFEGQSLTVTVAGHNTLFGQGTNTVLGLSDGTNTIWASNVVVNNPLELEGTFVLPQISGAQQRFDVFTAVDALPVSYLPPTEGFIVNGYVPGTLTVLSPDEVVGGTAFLVEVDYSTGGMTPQTPLFLIAGQDTLWPDSSEFESASQLRRWFTVPAQMGDGVYTVHIIDALGAVITAAETIEVDGSYLISCTPSTAFENTTLTVSLTGHNAQFGQGTATVVAMYNGTDTVFATNIVVANSNALTADFTLPSVVSDTVQYNVFTNGSTLAELPPENGFFVVKAPVAGALNLVSPNLVYAGVAHEVEVAYPNGGLDANTPFFLVNGTDTVWAGSAVSISNTNIKRKFVIPGSAQGSYDVHIWAPNGALATAGTTLPIQFDYIAFTTPESAPESVSLTVTLTGHNTLFGTGTSTLVGMYSASDTLWASSVVVNSLTSLSGEFTLPAIPGPIKIYRPFVQDVELWDARVGKVFTVVETPAVAPMSLANATSSAAGAASLISIDYPPGGLTTSTEYFLTQSSDTVPADSTMLQSPTQISGWFTLPQQASGAYHVNITTPGGEVATALDVVTIDHFVLELDGSTTNASCAADNGALSITPVNGTGPYSYTWSTGETTASIVDMPAGSYSVTVTDALGYSASETLALVSLPPTASPDNRICALEVTHGTDECSPNAYYSTNGFSPDGTAGSCWASGPFFNRWFKFQATNSYAQIAVKTGGAEGTMKYGLTTVQDSDGNELGCDVFSSGYSDLYVTVNTLQVGEWYYIEVDNLPGGSGAFTLCLDNQAGPSYVAGAHQLPNITGFCTGNAQYSTGNAIPDEAAGNCWAYGPFNNVWFQFVATTSFVDVQLKRGGAFGTIKYAMMGLWDDQLNELSCSAFTTSNSNLRMSATGLVPGQTYYISVDNAPNNAGSFTLCIDDKANYDYPAGAVDLTGLNGCSASGLYNTTGATPDGATASCWFYGPFRNRWFTFQAATTSMTVLVRTRKSYGTMHYPFAALYDDGFNELDCATFTNGNTQAIKLDATGLTIGNWYYFSVDNAGSTSSGTFTVCLDDGPGGFKAFDHLLDETAIAPLEALLVPNPTQSSTQLHLKGVVETASVRVLDLTGKSVLPTAIVGHNGRILLPTEHLAAGMYFVEVLHNGERLVERLVVHKVD